MVVRGLSDPAQAAPLKWVKIGRLNGITGNWQIHFDKVAKPSADWSRAVRRYEGLSVAIPPTFCFRDRPARDE
jgi:hypothetical protein